jgi:hypothetical protein
MARGIWAGVILLGVISLPAAAAEPGGVIEAIEARQDYIPVGKARLDTGEEWRFYLLDGPLSVRVTKPSQEVTRYAVLLDVEGGAALQIVEVGGVSCTDDTVSPSYRLVLDKEGKMLASTGLIEAEKDRQSLMTAAAVQNVAAYLCKGEPPPIKIKNQTLSDFR